MRYAALLAFAAAFLVLPAGCGVHTLRPPDAGGLPARYAGAGEAAPAEEAGRWWEGFNDPKLNGLMEEAFRGNLDIARAGRRLAQAEAAFKAAGAPRYPQAELAARAGQARASGATSESYRLSAAASYELDIWKKISSRAGAAGLDAAATREDVKALYISVSARVADLYYLAVEQKAQLELADGTIEAFEDVLERVEGRYREGLVPALDLYQSRQNLAVAKSQRPVFQANLETTLHALSVLLGRFPEEEMEGRAAELPEAPEFPAGLPSQLLARRPDIEAARLRVEAGDYRVAAAIADRFPSFNLIGDLGGGSQTLGTILDSPNIFWNVFLQAAMPVVDGGRRKAEVERADAAYEEALSAYRQALLTAFQEVEDALSSGRASRERITTLEESAEAAESALRLALERYLAGLGDYLPVLTAQQRYYDARSALLNARRQFISDRIALARAVGGEWAGEIAGLAGIEAGKGIRDEP